MNLLFPVWDFERDRIQSRLLSLAAVFLFLVSLILTLSPAVRLHSLQAELRWSHWAGYFFWLTGYALFHRQTLRRLPDRDPYLLPVVALLTGWGLLVIWRLDATFGLRQTIWLALSLAAAAFLLEKPSIRLALRRYKYVLLVSGLLLTALTFILGTYPGGEGPRLWLGCCGVYLQPSEPLKILLILYLAAYLADRLPMEVSLERLLAPTLVMAGAAVMLLVAQRDLGTTTLIVLIYTMVVYLASGRRRIILVAAGLIVVMAIAGYFLFDVIRLRVDAWLNPWADPTGRSYQIVQSLIAFASGGIMGTGPGLGSPGLVPVALSDFVSAAIGEEFGLLGIAALALLLGLLVVRGFQTAVNAGNRYERYLTIGVTTYFALQSILIIGGNIRLLPLTGVTLPFVSYGGSSLLTSMLAFTLLLGASDSQGADPLPLPQSRPFLRVAGVILAGLMLVPVFGGWWGFFTAGRLTARQENPRRAISDRYVARGQILDQNNRPLAVTNGEPGDYQRSSLYPPLSAAVGYHHPVYGQSGVESSMDAYLRGLAATPSSQILIHQLLYNQPPPGLTVRLAIDLELQRAIDAALGERRGAAVLLQAASGEVLAMASHPYADPNRLDTEWAELIEQQDAPLLNRATLGKYPLGSALGPFILAEVLDSTTLPPLSTNSSSITAGCGLSLIENADWNSLLIAGCPRAVDFLSRPLTANQIQAMYSALGFYSVPEVGIPVSAPDTPPIGASRSQLALGSTGLRASPLQMALAAATLSNQGLRPSPRLITAVQPDTGGWIVLPGGSSSQTFSAEATDIAATTLSSPTLPIWETVAADGTSGGAVWYLAGTLPQWQGAPLAFALIVEDAQPQEAYAVGQAAVKGVLESD